MPPTKPTLAVSDFIAASAPTRNEPSCSLNSTDFTFGRSTTASMIMKLLSGYLAAIFCNGVAYKKPTTRIGLKPLRARRSRPCSR